MDRILVVDDEPDIVRLTRVILERSGYRVFEASDGEETLRGADSEMPDLVLLDVVMPSRSGFEVCKTLKSQTKTKHIPVVIVTVLDRETDRKMAVEAGADGYLVKPFDHDRLLAEVRRCLDEARVEKFSNQLGVKHEKLQGRKILFEFDPSTPYDRPVRDFAIECAFHKEAVIVMSKRGSVVEQALQGDVGIELINLSENRMLSPIVQKHPEGPLSLVYDSLTDLALSTDLQTTYRFGRKSLEILDEPRITALFLLSPAAHEQKDIYSLRGLFSSQLACGKEGITRVVGL